MCSPERMVCVHLRWMAKCFCMLLVPRKPAAGGLDGWVGWRSRLLPRSWIGVGVDSTEKRIDGYGASVLWDADTAVAPQVEQDAETSHCLGVVVIMYWD